MVHGAVVQVGGELREGNVGPQHAAEVLQELGQAAAGQQRTGQDLVPGNQPFQLGVVVCRLGVRHQLADRDERGPVRDLDHRQSPPVGLGDHGRRDRLVREANTEPDAHRPCALDLPDKPALLRRGFQAQSGGEHQFAAVDEPLRVLQFRHRHPVDVLVPGGLGEACLGQVEGLHTKEDSEGNGHGSRIGRRWSIALNISFKGVQVAIPWVGALA